MSFGHLKAFIFFAVNVSAAFLLLQPLPLNAISLDNAAKLVREEALRQATPSIQGVAIFSRSYTSALNDGLSKVYESYGNLGYETLDFADRASSAYLRFADVLSAGVQEVSYTHEILGEEVASIFDLKISKVLLRERDEEINILGLKKEGNGKVAKEGLRFFDSYVGSLNVGVRELSLAQEDLGDEIVEGIYQIKGIPGLFVSFFDARASELTSAYKKTDTSVKTKLIRKLEAEKNVAAVSVSEAESVASILQAKAFLAYGHTINFIGEILFDGILGVLDTHKALGKAIADTFYPAEMLVSVHTSYLGGGLVLSENVKVTEGIPGKVSYESAGETNDPKDNERIERIAYVPGDYSTKSDLFSLRTYIDRAIENLNSNLLSRLDSIAKNVSGPVTNVYQDRTTTVDVDNISGATITGPLYDTNESAGTDGYVLQTTGTGVEWVATSTLGISGGGVSVWGDLTGTLADQTDLQGELDDRLTLSSWYSTTTDALTEGSTNLFSQWAGSGSDIYFNTGKVGIGESTPDAPLHVYTTENPGTQRTLLRLETADSQADTGYNIDFAQGGVVAQRIAGVYESAGVVGLGFSTYGGGLSEKLRITGTGNIGIGTTSPASKLVVQGPGSSGTATFKVAPASGSSYVQINDNGTMVINADVSSGTTPLDIKYNGSSQWSFGVTGGGNLSGCATCYINVGAGYAHILASGGAAQIKTYNELQFLPGALNGSGTHRISVISQNAADMPFAIKGHASQTGNLQEWQNSSSVAQAVVNSAGYFGLGTTSPSAKLSIHANNGDTNTTLFNIASSTANATTSIFTVKNSGYVGIGTENPGYTLEVNGTVRASNFSAGGTVTGINGMVTAGLALYGSGQVYGTGGDVYIKGQPDNVNFASGQGEVIISGGHVGGYQGTYVDGGNVKIFGGNAANDGYLGNTNPGNGGDIYLYGGTKVNSGSNGDIILAHNGTSAIGNVGIGTTSPYAKLSVTNEGTGPSFVVEDSSSPDSSPFIVDASGNVGIGISSPAAALDVGGSSRFLVQSGASPTGGARLLIGSGAVSVSNSGKNGYGLSSIAGNFGTFQNDASNTWSLGYTANINNLGTPVLSWGTAGNVGIGTTSPTQTLSVNGAISLASSTKSKIVAENGNVDILEYLTDGTLNVRAYSTRAVQFYSGTTRVGYADPSTGIAIDNGLGLRVGSSSNTIYQSGYSGSINLNNSMYVYGSGASSYAGNVGIGTTSPYMKLAVVGTQIIKNDTAASTVLSINGASSQSGAMQRWMPTADTVANANNSFIDSNGRFVAYNAHGNISFGSTDWSNHGDKGIFVGSTQVLNFYTGNNTLRIDPTWSFGLYSNEGAQNTLSIHGGGRGNAGDGGLVKIRGGHAYQTSGNYNGGNLYLYGGNKTAGGTGIDGAVVLAHDGSSAIGNVGVATTTPWKKLSVTGTVGFDGLSTAAGSPSALCLSSDKEVVVNTGTATCTVSSARFKEDIIYEGVSGLDVVLALKPATFRYKDSELERVGFIAEDVNLVESKLTFTESDGVTLRGVRYEDMTAVLAKAIQELNAKFEDMKTSFLAGVTEFKEIIVSKITSEESHTDKLCIEDVCITRDDLAAILESSNVNVEPQTQSEEPAGETNTNSEPSTSTEPVAEEVAPTETSSSNEVVPPQNPASTEETEQPAVEESEVVAETETPASDAPVQEGDAVSETPEPALSE